MFLRIAVLLVLALAVPAEAQETAVASASIKLDSNLGIEIVSERLVIKDADHTAVFSGGVSMVQGTATIKAGNMMVYYQGGASVSSGQASIERLEFRGGVHLQSEDQVATGDAATYDLSTRVFNLVGKKVTYTQGNRTLVGCRLVANGEQNSATVFGCQVNGQSRIQMVLDPR